MEKVKITVENEKNEKSEITLKFNNDNTMDVNIEFEPSINRDTDGSRYLSVTTAIFEALTK